MDDSVSGYSLMMMMMQHLPVEAVLPEICCIDDDDWEMANENFFDVV
jgi:hypothetical protein